MLVGQAIFTTKTNFTAHMEIILSLAALVLLIVVVKKLVLPNQNTPEAMNDRDWFDNMNG